MLIYIITLAILIIIYTIASCIAYIIRKNKYEETEYYQQTHLPYRSVGRDKGHLGEYYTYRYLVPLPGYKRFLFNLYIPKENGETTELDVTLLHESGIYVFESKNYSGWIFGTESQKYWTQTLPIGRGRTQKNQFYNPIWQNNTHLKWLQAFLGDQTIPFYSYIVFSDRCVLKDITLTSGNHYVANQCYLFSMVQQNAERSNVRLSADTIDKLFEKLYPLTQVEEAKKIEHIKAVQQASQNAYKNFTSVKTETSSYTASNIEDALCPRCGGKLVVRISAKGEHKGEKFLGCSNYPKCRYIQSIPAIKETVSHSDVQES